MKIWVFLVFSLLLSLFLEVSAEQCGRQAGGALCPGGQCCSQFGWCGNTDAYCGSGCQSQCGGSGGGGDLTSIISREKFNEMLKHRNDGGCPAKGFYTYDAFISAAKAFPGFGTTGDVATRKREIAAFFGQTSHETTGGWKTAPDGPYAWGYCYVREQNPGSYCAPSSTYPCAGGKQYYGRGPMQLSWNYNYGQCGRAIGVDLLNNPDLVATDPVISFKTAIWFWMTPQSPKPSCHNVITGRWSPSGADSAAGRVPGYGALTNIINGGLECGMGWKSQVEDRIGFYKRMIDRHCKMIRKLKESSGQSMPVLHGHCVAKAILVGLDLLADCKMTWCLKMMMEMHELSSFLLPLLPFALELSTKLPSYISCTILCPAFDIRKLRQREHQNKT